MRIKPLSIFIANQIAAGEVIENPASVVKELLENALDAKATSITIDIGFGGLNQIKISDNGVGIVADDLMLAIAPHATSKLVQLEDLSTLTSMGFRGEALASIASVSRLTLSSKPAAQQEAMMLQPTEQAYQLLPCARNQGTTIDVRDLFYNAPVRRRFLKSERSEYLAIELMVKRFALSAPNIALLLKHNGKLVFELPAATCEQTKRLRIQRLLGKLFIDASIHIEVEHAGMALVGWVSGAGYQRSQNDKQWIYLNQRMVKDKLIYHAFRQAYDNRLYPGKHPACVLYLTIPSQEVDVNVHPTKHEVRFQQPRLVHDFIGKHIQQALAHIEPTLEPAFATVSCSFEQRSNPDINAVVLCEDLSPRKTSATLIESYDNLPAEPMSYRLPERIGPHPQNENKENVPSGRRPAFAAMSHRYATHWMILNPLFGLMTWNGNAYLVNMARAQQERGLFHLNLQALPLASRPLLVPVSEIFSDDTCTHLEGSFALFLKFGLHLERIDSRVVIRTLPVVLPQLNVKQLLALAVSSPLTEAHMPMLLMSCLSTDAHQLSMEDKALLSDYLIHHLEQDPLSIRSWCLSLDIDRCQELMRA